MSYKKLFMAVLEDKDNFGIEANISVYPSQDKAIKAAMEHYNKNVFPHIQGAKPLPMGYPPPMPTGASYTCYQQEDENKNQYAGTVLAKMASDYPRLETNDYPYSMRRLINLLDAERLQLELLQKAMQYETDYKAEQEIATLNQYEENLKSIASDVTQTIKSIKFQKNRLWLSMDEGLDGMDYALFHNKDTAKEYLSCRFLQAVSHAGYDNEKSREAKDNFRRHGKTEYMLIGSNHNYYGKIIPVMVCE